MSKQWQVVYCSHAIHLSVQSVHGIQKACAWVRMPIRVGPLSSRHLHNHIIRIVQRFALSIQFRFRFDIIHKMPQLYSHFVIRILGNLLPHGFICIVGKQKIQHVPKLLLVLIKIGDIQCRSDCQRSERHFFLQRSLIKNTLNCNIYFINWGFLLFIVSTRPFFWK